MGENNATRLEIVTEASERVARLVFGDPITNICAGENNPSRHAYFVRLVNRSSINRGGITHTSRWVNCTDRRGKFWDTAIDVIYPGHLDYEKCGQLFAPVHAALYGD